MSVFLDDADCAVFLAILRRISRLHRLPVHSFVLMKTHYHFLTTPPDTPTLAEAMARLSKRYVKYFNRRYERCGTPWCGRYRGIPIGDDRYLLNCTRYIEQNPVRARLVLNPADYRWSSYGVNALGHRSDWLVPHPVFESLGPTPQERQRVYRALCEAPLTETELVQQRLNEAASEVADNIIDPYDAPIASV